MDAGRQLASALAAERIDDPVVLALPRGGVPVAFEVASALAAPLDLLFVRKIGAPVNQEVAIGAVVDGKEPQIVVNDEILAQSGASLAYVDQEARRQLEEIDRRRKIYLGNRRPLDLQERHVIVVDDGIATGATVKAGLKALGRIGAASVTLAAPVAPSEVLDELRPLVTRIVCLQVPADFLAVGHHYRDFRQTTDAEVMDVLARVRTPE